MKKNKIVVALALLLGGTALAADLNVAEAYAAAISSVYHPHYYVNSLKKLLSNDVVECDNYAKIDNPDNWWWLFPNERNGTFAYMLFRFSKPAGYTAGNLRWRINAASNQTVYLYRYKRQGDNWIWEYMDEYTGPMGEYRTVYVPAGYFGDEGNLWVMADVLTMPGARWEKCDVLDIQY